MDYMTVPMEGSNVNKYVTFKGLCVCLVSFVALALLDVLLLLAIYMFYSSEISLLFVIMGYLLSALTLTNLVLLGIMCVILRKRNII